MVSARKYRENTYPEQLKKSAVKLFFSLSWLLNIVFLLFSTSVWSQNIAINTSGSAANASAMLDVSATNKGILIPNVALTSATDNSTISSPAATLLVYNTGTGGLTPAGYYYNKGTSASPSWIQLITSQSISSSNVAVSTITNEMDGVNGAPCTGASCTGAAMTTRNCSITCDNLVYNGYSDWRIPTIEELMTLVNVAPNNTNTGSVWSCTPNFGSTGKWAGMLESDGNWTSTTYSSTTACRCVR